MLGTWIAGFVLLAAGVAGLFLGVSELDRSAVAFGLICAAALIALITGVGFLKYCIGETIRKRKNRT